MMGGGGYGNSEGGWGAGEIRGVRGVRVVRGALEGLGCGNSGGYSAPHLIPSNPITACAPPTFIFRNESRPATAAER